MKKIFRYTDLLFDKLYSFWESNNNQRITGSVMVIAFLLALLLIQFNIWGILPEWLHKYFPANHFYAIEIAFSLLLVFEVISLVFALAHSVARSLAMQFEILSLILLRESFKEFGNFEEPIQWEAIYEPVYHILSDSFGALLIFGGVIMLKHIQKHRPINPDSKLLTGFGSSKKVISLALLLIFLLVGLYDLGDYLINNNSNQFFETFYTVLIFSDVLIVLISLRYSNSYSVVFRNSGFALATVVIRLALTAPTYINAIIGVAALIFVLSISFIYNKYPVKERIIDKQI